MNQKVQLVTSKDGSHTLFVPGLNEHYHSVNGAIQESLHVFIEAGLYQIKKENINILEFGFGTGLNAFLTAIKKHNKKIFFHSLEKYPIDSSTIKTLNYKDAFDGKYTEVFSKLHECNWEHRCEISDYFSLLKTECDFKNVKLTSQYDLIYFDAFAPDIQPKLWTREIFEKAYNALLPNGILTTYCAKGIVRRTMQEVGFKVERLPGPPGKREMLRAIK